MTAAHPATPDTPATTPRVAVVGVGAIGSVHAAALQNAGAGGLILCARPGHAPVTVEHPDGRRTRVTAPMVTSPAAAEPAEGPADWVLLAVKSHQTAGAADWLRALATPATTVVVLQNGVEHRELVAPFAGGATVLPAIVWCPAEAAGAGQVRQRGPARLVVAAGDAGRRLRDLLAGGSVDVELTDDFVTEAWQKLTVNAVSGLSALAGRGAGIYRDPAMAELARRLAAECVAVGRAEGAQLAASLPDEIVARMAAQPPGTGSSILADRLAGRPLEWDARNGVIQRLGARHAIPTPVSDVIVPLLAAA